MNTDELIKEKFEKLPKELQDTLVSPETQKLVQTVGQKYKLHIDDIGALETEMMLVLLGIEHPNDFLKNIVRETGMSQDDAKAAAKELEEKLFLPMRSSLERIYEKDQESERDQEFAPTKGVELENTQIGILTHNLPAGVSGKRTAELHTEEENDEKSTEHTTPPVQRKRSILEAKMEGGSALPNTERVEDVSTHKTTDEVQTKKYPGEDPYRELPQ